MRCSRQLVAGPLKDPLEGAGTVPRSASTKFTKELKDGDTATWGGYTFKFHHLPGQSWFTSGIEATIDGNAACSRRITSSIRISSKVRGWMGWNRSSPAVYGTSASKVLDIAPEWVLSTRRAVCVRQGRLPGGGWAGRSSGEGVRDALQVSGDHRHDRRHTASAWNP
ncbi:MAG: hypothetical protein U0792_13875 [Gemmataceae bacterium]